LGYGTLKDVGAPLPAWPVFRRSVVAAFQRSLTDMLSTTVAMNQECAGKFLATELQSVAQSTRRNRDE